MIGNAFQSVILKNNNSARSKQTNKQTNMKAIYLFRVALSLFCVDFDLMFEPRHFMTTSFTCVGVL